MSGDNRFKRRVRQSPSFGAHPESLAPRLPKQARADEPQINLERLPQVFWQIKINRNMGFCVLRRNDEVPRAFLVLQFSADFEGGEVLVSERNVADHRNYETIAVQYCCLHA